MELYFHAALFCRGNICKLNFHLTFCYSFVIQSSFFLPRVLMLESCNLNGVHLHMLKHTLWCLISHSLKIKSHFNWQTQNITQNMNI